MIGMIESIMPRPGRGLGTQPVRKTPLLEAVDGRIGESAPEDYFQSNYSAGFVELTP
jgi:hypothetical protein